MIEYQRPRPVWKWRAEAPPDRIDRLAEEAGLSRGLAEILLRRGVGDAPSVDGYLNATLDRLTPPDRMKDMDKATERLARAIAEGQRTVIYGDYDVDGTTATSVLLSFYRDAGLGDLIDFYIPDRIEEGYGLNIEAVDHLAASGFSVLVTVDTGISSVEAVAHAQQAGLDVIVTDHHTPPETLPPAYAILNPKRTDCEFGFDMLAGVGLAFYLVIGLRARLRDEGMFENRPAPNLKRYLDLVAIGTVADVAPLTDENRLLVREGIAEIEAGRRPGVRALIEVSGLEGRPVGPGQIGFQIAPRINAAGRVGHARDAVRLLTAESMEEARPLAEALDEANRERREIEAEVFESVLRQFEEDPQRLTEPIGLCVAGENWHPGVIGIVASRLVDRFYKPTIMISIRDGVGKGSARSVEGVNLYETLADASENLIQFGGHAAAAGMTVRAEKIGDFRADFERALAKRLNGRDRPRPVVRVDVIYGAEEINERKFEEIQKLQPFGSANPQPVGALLDVKVIDKRVLKERHLKLTVSADGRKVDAIGFNMDDRGLQVGDRIDIAGHLHVNEFRGGRYPQMKMTDFRPASNLIES